MYLDRLRKMLETLNGKNIDIITPYNIRYKNIASCFGAFQFVHLFSTDGCICYSQNQLRFIPWRCGSLTYFMIPIRRSYYETEESIKTAFSRLKWQVEKVNSLTGQLLYSYTKDTNKNWIGKTDERNFEFSIMEPRGLFTPKHFFRLFYFQFIVKGHLEQMGTTTRIKISFKLSWFYFMFMSLIYLSTLIFIYNLIIVEDWTGFKDLLGWLLAFPITGTLVMIIQLNKVENKIMDLFDI